MADDESSWLSHTKFWILVILSSGSIICSIFMFIYFYRQRKKLSVHQHLTIVLVLTSFIQITTDFPFQTLYQQYRVVIPSSDTFCLLWNWWDYALSGSLVFAMAWGSCERHLLIFYNSLMSTKRKRLIFHILPMLSISIYPFIFYFAVIVLNSCENQWDYGVVSSISLF
jgi:hypothetical protein